MKKILGVFVFVLVTTVSLAQNTYENEFPLFENCKTDVKTAENVEICFYDEVLRNFRTYFSVSQELQSTAKELKIRFEVTKEGVFKLQYVDTDNQELRKALVETFSNFPKVEPVFYDGRPTYSQFLITMPLPIENEEQPLTSYVTRHEHTYNYSKPKYIEGEHGEYDAINIYEFDNPKFKSSQTLPFSHQNYALFEQYLQQVGTNAHTASKPFLYRNVSKYFDLENHVIALQKEKSSWWGKKIWNENLVQIQGDGYWFTFDPILDIRIGKDIESDLSYTYHNTRGFRFEGGLGKHLSFSTSFYESQGRFADYYNRFSESIKPSGGNPAVIPGVGIAKSFKTDSYDFPMAEAYLTFAPGQFMDLTLGYGRNFLGDGYRSLLWGDHASPYPFVKLNTTFWKIKYTNTYTWMKDIREDALEDRTYASKFIANHYLSWNVTKRWNLGLFESVVWTNSNGRGFDMNFVNPIIFYRAVEFNSSSRSGNAVIGLTSKYKFSNQFLAYGQLIIDEFSFDEVREGNKSWKNKHGYQLGVKYFEAFGWQPLQLQLEYNRIRPYVYSHTDPLTNYGHNNQSMGHAWGANLEELILIGRYQKDRWISEVKFTYGRRGFDYNTAEDQYNYGGNIYINYNTNRPRNNNVTVGQGNTTSITMLDAQIGYLVNPMTNLKVFGQVMLRDFDPMKETADLNSSSTAWFSIGLRSDLFNWYLDY